MRGPGPCRGKVNAVREKDPYPGRPQRNARAKAAPGDQEDRNAGERVNQAVEGVNGKDRQGGVNSEKTEKSGHNERINRRHDRRWLGGNKRAAEAVACQQRTRHIALLPGVDVVGVHQVLEEEAVERNYRQAENQRNQHHPNQDRHSPQPAANKGAQAISPVLPPS